MQDLQREEMYCRNRSSAGAEVGGHWTLSSEYGALSNEHWVVSTAQYCSAVIFTQLSAEGAEYHCQPAHIFTSFSIQVSRDCFVLQWFEDKLGCHGKRQKQIKLEKNSPQKFRRGGSRWSSVCVGPTSAADPASPYRDRILFTFVILSLHWQWFCPLSYEWWGALKQLTHL